jgi:hypothetical protein
VGISTTDYQLFITFFGNLMGNSWEIAKSRIRILKIIKLMEKSILLHRITPDELKQIIKVVIQEEFLDVRKQLLENNSEILLTRKETCEFLKIDSSTLWSWTNKGKIVCYGIGNRRYYKKEDLLDSLVILKVKRA